MARAYQSAKTGKFVTRAYAQSHPNTTIAHNIKRKK